MKTFRANGKLLISGEYTILDGSLSMALPTKRGQVLHYKEVDHDILHWRSLDIKGETWFEAHFKGNELTIVDSSDDRKAETLKEILLTAAGLSIRQMDLGRGNHGFGVPNKLGIRLEFNFAVLCGTMF